MHHNTNRKGRHTLRAAFTPLRRVKWRWLHWEQVQHYQITYVRGLNEMKHKEKVRMLLILNKVEDVSYGYNKFRVINLLIAPNFKIIGSICSFIWRYFNILVLFGEPISAVQRLFVDKVHDDSCICISIYFSINGKSIF